MAREARFLEPAGRRIVQATAGWERRLQSRRPRRARWHGGGGLNSRLRRFVLTAALTAGGSATANPLIWDPSGDGAWVADTDTEITVTDTLGYWESDDGGKGIYETRMAENGLVYDVVLVECPA